MIRCVIFTSFTKVVGESVGYLLGFLWNFWNKSWIRLNRCCLNDVLYYWETQAQCCTAAEVAPCFICFPAPQTPHASTPSFEEEQVSCQDVTLLSGLVWLSVLHSWQFTSIKLSWTYRLIREMMPLGLGMFALVVAWLPFCLPCSIFLKASCLNQARPLLVPFRRFFFFSLPHWFVFSHFGQ